MDSSPIELKYSGPRTKPTMQLWEMSQVLSGASDFFSAAAYEYYGGEAQVEIRFENYGRGSEIIAFALTIAGAMAHMLPHALTFSQLIGEALKLQKHLQGKEPRKVEPRDGGVSVENSNGNIAVFNNSTVNLVLNLAQSGGVEKFVKAPLNRGAQGLEVKIDDELVERIVPDEADFFVPVNDNSTTYVSRSDIALTIRTVVLDGGGMWRFHDGRGLLSAGIEDAEFLERVRGGKERFGSGDRLHVRLRSEQFRQRGELKVRHSIEQVLGHERPEPTGQGQLV